MLEFRKLLDIWTSNSWLCSHDFKCDDQIIEESIRVFQSDYSRWYPNDRTINVYNIQYTPQLIAMLLYRISRNVYLSNLKSNVYGGFMGGLMMLTNCWLDILVRLSCFIRLILVKG